MVVNSQRNYTYTVKVLSQSGRMVCSVERCSSRTNRRTGCQNVGQSTNSIFGIIHHLVFCNERYLQRFKDSSLPPLKISNAETFVKDSDDIVGSWDDLHQRLDNLFVQWEEAIIECYDAKLDSRTHPDRDESWCTSLAHMAIHNAHHIGQIVHIRKELGIWETWFE